MGFNQALEMLWALLRMSSGKHVLIFARVEALACLQFLKQRSIYESAMKQRAMGQACPLEDSPGHTAHRFQE